MHSVAKLFCACLVDEQVDQNTTRDSVRSDTFTATEYEFVSSIESNTRSLSQNNQSGNNNHNNNNNNHRSNRTKKKYKSLSTTVDSKYKISDTSTASSTTYTKHNRIDTNLARQHYKDILFNNTSSTIPTEEEEEHYFEKSRLSIVDTISNTISTEIPLKMSSETPSTSIIRSSSKIFDEEYIYKYLDTQINDAKTYWDLHNLIHNLLPINELKKILSNQLTKLRDQRKQKQQTNANKQNKKNNNNSNDNHSNDNHNNDEYTSRLQKLYLQSASLEEIFSDDILVNIIRYLPSSNYPRIPCISRNFRVIMKKYSTIYQQYTVNIALDSLLLNNDGVLWIVINHNNKSIRIIHRIKNNSGKQASFDVRNDSISIRRQFEEDVVLNDPNAIKYEIRNIDDITNKVPFLWYCCKKWNIGSMKKIKAGRSFVTPASSHHAPSMMSYRSNRSTGGTHTLQDYNKYRSTTNLSTATSPLMQDDSSDHPHGTPSPYTPDNSNNNNNNNSNVRYEITINETPTITHHSIGNTSSSSNFGTMANGLNLQLSQENIIQQQQDENNLFVAILNKSSNYIESICIDAINDKDGAKWNLLNKLKRYKLLSHLCINQVIHNSILDSWLNTKLQLKAIKYLELRHLNQINLDKLKQLIENLSNLMVFDCYMTNNVNEQNEFFIITFPSKLQFIRLQFVGSNFNINLSQCNNLCALYLNDTLSDSPALHPIFSQNENDDDSKLNGDIHDKMHQEIYENITWPKYGGIECLLLEQAMDDVHNINNTVPLYINEWYSTLSSNTLIPVRCVRYITHPFIERNKPRVSLRQSSGASATSADDDEEDMPGPPPLLGAQHVRLSASPPAAFSSNRFDDYGDPFKYERDKQTWITLEELKQIAFDFQDEKQIDDIDNNDDNSYIINDYKHDIVKVLDGDDDHLYRGHLWELLLRVKFRNKSSKFIEEQLEIYQNWYDIGIGNWIRECGADFHKYNFSNASLKFLHPYSVSYRNPRPTGW